MITSEYDVYLGSKSALQGYRLRNLNRDSAPLIAPKFSSGAEGQTDLDLLKSVSVDDLSGGMFQRDWIAPNKVARAIGVFNPMDKNLYPSPAPTQFSSDFSTGYVLCKVESQLTTYFVTGRYVLGSGAGTGWVNRLFTANTDGTLTEITLPATFNSSSPGFITDIALHGGYLYISSGFNRNNYRMKLDTLAFQDIGGQGCIMRELRGVMYHINNTSNLYSMSNEFAAGSASYTFLDVVGLSNASTASPSDCVEFNSALWICKPDGIFRFDGVRAVKVLDLVTRKFCIYNGAIYFFAGHWLYKFDGANVTKLQYFDTEEELSLSPFAANADYLFIQTRIVDYSSYSATYDKVTSGGGIASGRIYVYDGAAFTMLHEKALTSGYSAPYTGIVRTGNFLLDLNHEPLSASDTPQYKSTYARFNLQYLFTASYMGTTSKLEVTSSEFDAGFPNILKTLNAIEVSHSGMLATDSLVVKYSLFDGKTWSAWLTLGTITSTSANYLEVSDETMLFRRVKFNVTASLSASTTLKLKSLSLRYTIQPRHRWRWQLTIAAFGDMLKKRTGAASGVTANSLSNYITKAIRQKTPNYFFSPDHAIVKTQASAAATTIVLAGEFPIYTDPYGELQLVAVLNQSGVWEILRVNTAVYDSGTNETTITVLERGFLSIVPAIIPAGAQFHAAHRVYVTRLIRENTILSEETYDEGSLGNSQIQREFILEVTEV